MERLVVDTTLYEQLVTALANTASVIASVQVSGATGPDTSGSAGVAGPEQRGRQEV